MGRIITLSALAVLGFIVGVAGFLAYELLAAGIPGYLSLAAITATSAWFVSGLAGSTLAMVLVVAIAYTRHD